SLGVLNDVTVTQASTVWEIHAANPTGRPGDLYRSGMRVGRDHIASTVYTLVLAYAGASLSLLILFTVANQPGGHLVTGALLVVEVLGQVPDRRLGQLLGFIGDGGILLEAVPGGADGLGQPGAQLGARVGGLLAQHLFGVPPQRRRPPAELGMLQHLALELLT